MNAIRPSELGLGIFPLTEAARLAQLDIRTAKRWALGYNYTHRGEARQSQGVMPLRLSQIGSGRDLTFREMLTLRLVSGFRTTGLSLSTIKRVAERAAQEYGQPLPFVSRRFRTDGRKVFVELTTESAAQDEPSVPRKDRHLIEVLTGQQNFSEVVEPSLFADVDWEDDLASRWWPLGRERHVTLDPDVLFGAPHIANTRVASSVVATSVVAEGGGDQAEAAVAEWYGLELEAVRDAVAFETKWRNKAT